MSPAHLMSPRVLPKEPKEGPVDGKREGLGVGYAGSSKAPQLTHFLQDWDTPIPQGHFFPLLPGRCGLGSKYRRNEKMSPHGSPPTPRSWL